MLFNSRMPGIINTSLLLKYGGDDTIKWLENMFGAIVLWLILSDKKHLVYHVLVWRH